MRELDLVVIGSGPAGQKAAIQAAKLRQARGHRRMPSPVGGVCVNTGTIPSKTLREAALYLTGLNQRELYGQSYRVKQEITIGDLLWRTTQVIERERDVVRAQLARNHIALIEAKAASPTRTRSRRGPDSERRSAPISS